MLLFIECLRLVRSSSGSIFVGVTALGLSKDPILSSRLPLPLLLLLIPAESGLRFWTERTEEVTESSLLHNW